MDFLTHMQQQIDALEAQKANLNPNSPDDNWQIKTIENQQAAIRSQMEELQNQQVAAQLKIQQDHEERVNVWSNDFFDKVDNLPISNGLTLRDMIPDPDLYQATSIELKGLFQTWVNDLSSKLKELEEENSQQIAINKKDQEDLSAEKLAHAQTKAELNQEKLDHAQTQQYQRNATSLLEEAQREIEQLKEQLKAATENIKPTNTEDEQKKKAELDLKIKRERTIYNKVQDDEFNPRFYYAKRAIDGEPTPPIPFYAINSYFEIKEHEVPQFRAQYGSTETTTPTEDSAGTTDPIQENPSVPVTEGEFPEVPTAEAPEVPPVPAPVVTGQPETSEDRGVTQAELETRLAQFAQEYGLVKGQVA